MTSGGRSPVREWPVGLLDILRLLLRQDEDSLDVVVRAVQTDAATMLSALDTARLTGPFLALATDTRVFNALSVRDREALRSAAQTQREANAAYLDLLADYAAELGQRGVDMALLKGLYIAQRFHGDIAQRFMWDADVLVRPEDYDEAVAAAAGMGLPVRRTRAPRWLLQLAGLHALEVGRKGRAIDIHWCFRARPGYTIDYAAFWKRTRQMNIKGESFRVPADEDAFFLALLELASDMERSRIKLRSLWDFYLMLKALDSCMSWDEFLAQRQEEGLLQLTLNMLAFGLFCVDGYADFPQASAAIAKRGAMLLIDSSGAASEVLARPVKHLANRSIYARLQPGSVSAYWLRRALTSPLRRRLAK